MIVIHPMELRYYGQQMGWIPEVDSIMLLFQVVKPIITREATNEP